MYMYMYMYSGTSMARHCSFGITKFRCSFGITKLLNSVYRKHQKKFLIKCFFQVPLWRLAAPSG